MKRGIAAGLFVLILLLLYGLGWHHYLSLKNLQGLQLELSEFQASHQVVVAAAYFLSYLVYSVTGVPGISVLNIFGGALLGFKLGAFLSITAVSLGSLGGFLFARFIFRNYIQKKFAKRIAKIEEQLKKEGSWFLLSLRLVPVIPYSILNFIFGLTPMRSSAFLFATFFGLIPMTFLYSYLGHEVSSNFQSIQSVSELISWKILLGLSLLALFPYLAKKFVLPLILKKKEAVYVD